jgi:hypothetical protein
MKNKSIHGPLITWNNNIHTRKISSSPRMFEMNMGPIGPFHAETEKKHAPA